MGTNFTAIYDRFLGKITDDMYMELTPQDTIKDLQRLLIDSIPGFEFPRKNLYNYEIRTNKIPESEVTDKDYVLGPVWEEIFDDEFDVNNIGELINNTENITLVLVEESLFLEELTAEEQEILALLMMTRWLQRQVTSIENTRMKYSGSDFKMTSQANHLSKLQSLLNECQKQCHHMQRLYKRREFNEDGQYISSWYWFGQNGTNNIRE